MLGWLKRNKKRDGWFAASLQPAAVEFAHGELRPAGKPTITAFGIRDFEVEKSPAQRFAQEMRIDRFECSALLAPNEYQMLLVEAPNVSREELRAAIRWKIKDLIDYHVEDATVDVLDIPATDGTARNHMMYAVAARNDLLLDRIRQFEEAHIPISVIDVRETAQRNIASLYETDDRGVALVYLSDAWGLLTVNYKRELYLARRLEFGLDQLSAASHESGGLERMAVEVQRTLDHFERQYRGVAVAKVLLAPTPKDIGLAELLRSRLGIEFQPVDLRNVLVFDDAGPDAATQWRLFHHFGAALRHESKAL